MLKFLQVQDSRVCCRLKLADSVMVGFDVGNCHSGGAMVVIVMMFLIFWIFWVLMMLFDDVLEDDVINY
ncbi:hypothetical protein HanPI659440_Chr16g0659121 [Helianthus annuus]|nr:hypothetical protein HanPI659440_Chr16g0659121 [Helianthus annuus]